MVGLDEYHFMHLETLDQDVAKMNQMLCEHWGHCERGGLKPLPKENDTGGGKDSRLKSFEWPTELARQVVQRYSCMFEYFGYSTDPTQKKPKEQHGPRKTITKEAVRHCVSGLSDLPVFHLRFREDTRHLEAASPAKKARTAHTKYLLA